MVDDTTDTPWTTWLTGRVDCETGKPAAQVGVRGRSGVLRAANDRMPKPYKTGKDPRSSSKLGDTARIAAFAQIHYNSYVCNATSGPSGLRAVLLLQPLHEAWSDCVQKATWRHPLQFGEDVLSTGWEAQAAASAGCKFLADLGLSGLRISLRPLSCRNGSRRMCGAVPRACNADKRALSKATTA